MSSFPGGSAWAMVKDISHGYILLNARSFIRFTRPQLDQINFELERRVREVRSDQPKIDDTAAVQDKQRRLSRLTSARTMLLSFRRQRKI